MTDDRFIILNASHLSLKFQQNPPRSHTCPPTFRPPHTMVTRDYNTFLSEMRQK